MQQFQKVVLGGAIILLVISLVIIGKLLMSNKDGWPPIDAKCPDYWISRGNEEAEQNVCINKRKMGICNTKIMNFNKPPFNSEDGACKKYQWANKCKVAWDGITYGVSNPCDDNDDDDNDDE